MPQMSGRELAERVAKIRPDLPVLFMSGYADGLLAPARVLEPGVELLEKPFTQATLLAAVANSLRVL
jgi:FixJ family two-component response regulator